MEELIAKRKQYFAELAAIYEKAEERAKEFFNEKVQALMAEKEEKKKEFLKEYQADLDIITAKLKLLDEIITEQMPEAKPLNDLMAKEPEVVEEAPAEQEEIAEPVMEEVKEEVIAEEPVAEEIKEEPEMVEEVKEENIIAVEEVEEVPEEAQVVDCVEILPEEPIVEEAPIIEEAAPEMEVKEELKHVEARPGMPEILNPR